MLYDIDELAKFKHRNTRHVWVFVNQRNVYDAHAVSQSWGVRPLKVRVPVVISYPRRAEAFKKDGLSIVQVTDDCVERLIGGDGVLSEEDHPLLKIDEPFIYDPALRKCPDERLKVVRCWLLLPKGLIVFEVSLIESKLDYDHFPKSSTQGCHLARVKRGASNCQLAYHLHGGERRIVDELHIEA